jgi:N6-L-threonylcarbamoyladenine synthase
VLFPTPGLSTDNAAMIAAAAFPKLARREFAGLDILADASHTLA